MIVVDASAVACALLEKERGAEVTAAMRRAAALAAPDHMAVEVLSVVRGWTRGRRVDVPRAADALHAFGALPIRWYESRRLVWPAWSLRDNASAYDAPYLALADALGTVVLSLDVRLQRAFPRLVLPPEEI